MPQSDLGLCWACQDEFTEESAVWIDDQEAVQCCFSCWKKIDPAERVKIALLFHDRTPEGLGVRETMDSVRDLIADAIHGYFERRIGDDEARRN